MFHYFAGNAAALYLQGLLAGPGAQQAGQQLALDLDNLSVSLQQALIVGFGNTHGR